MSSMSSPTPSVNSPSISHDTLAAAAERRTSLLAATPQKTAAQLAAEHDKRQKFRRMVDPGITRPNSQDQAQRSLKVNATPLLTLLTIAENLLREPDNPKYQQFKPTNTVIKRDLVDPKGALEYAIELGFKAEVHNFQPYYRFHHRHMEELQIGTKVLKEFVSLEAERQERIAKAKAGEKAAREAAAELVKLAFMDDRKNKELRDEMDKEQREGRAIAARRAALATSTPGPEPTMPGSGHSLDSPTIDQNELPGNERAGSYDNDG
ncbi:unnamed protein product [Cyclocybe aegerita]|uniref:PUB domain-containing protein n=1 Tax=Cyclocybe aegerita TaxID=1973307 RepID=A0A8S0VTA3_CYCAE|nr:unnamed protein product [Cyclocybe aegerita]